MRPLGSAGIFLLLLGVGHVAAAQERPRLAPSCGNGYCDEWAKEDCESCSADCCPGVAAGTPPDVELRSPGLIGGGVLLTLAGIVGVAISAVALSGLPEHAVGSDGKGGSVEDGPRVACFVGAGLGLVGVAGGLVMISIGATSVPVSPPRSTATTRRGWSGAPGLGLLF